jgi:hypothetical protein
VAKKQRNSSNKAQKQKKMSPLHTQKGNKAEEQNKTGNKAE